MRVDATSIRSLGALLRSGLTIRQALDAWPEELDNEHREGPALVRERLALGATVSSALSGLPDQLGEILPPVFSLHQVAGGDVAAALDRVAEAIEQETTFQQDAKAASSGARLSGRLVAGLPLAFLPFSSASRALGDGTGMVMLAIGVILATVGLRWIGRLVPAPPPADASTQFCRAVAALLRGGLSFSHAMAILESHPPRGLEASLTRAGEQVRLGRTWRAALGSSSCGLGRVARVIERAERAGVPVADSLDHLAEALQGERSLAFKTKMRRAPVLMVLPLTCCILPAYGLLAIGPFLRSVTLG